jgi:hypothetical protein
MGMLRYASKADIVSADVVAVVSVVSLAYQIGGRKEGELLKMSTLCIPPMSTTYFRPGRCAELIRCCLYSAERGSCWQQLLLLLRPG